MKKSLFTQRREREEALAKAPESQLMKRGFYLYRHCHYADFKPAVKKGPFLYLYLKSPNRKAPHGYIEGLGCVQGGLVDLPQPFCWIYNRSTSPPWQISAGASYTPTVKNLSCGTSKSGKGKAPANCGLTHSLLCFRR